MLWACHTIISLYLSPLPGAGIFPIKYYILHVMNEPSLLCFFSNNPFFYDHKGLISDHAAQEATPTCM